MINQALNIANLLRQSNFEFLDENDKIENLKIEHEFFKQFNKEINQGKNNE